MHHKVNIGPGPSHSMTNLIYAISTLILLSDLCNGLSINELKMEQFLPDYSKRHVFSRDFLDIDVTSDPISSLIVIDDSNAEIVPQCVYS